MDYASQNIINAMSGSIFGVSTVDPQILHEVGFFKNLLITNINNPEVFHGYINKISESWGIILTSGFKNLIINYNQLYFQYQNKKTQKEQELIQLADEFNIKQLEDDFLGLNKQHDVNYLISGMSRSSISKKKPSKKKPISHSLFK